MFNGFRLSEPSARLFDSFAGRIGAIVSGRKTYDDSNGFGGDGSPHPTAPLFVLSHRPPPETATERQTFVPSLEEAIEAARAVAGDKDVGLQGGGVATAALAAGLLDEFVIHQVPILLGEGRPFFGELPANVKLTLVQVVPAPGVTHLHYRVERR